MTPAFQFGNTPRVMPNLRSDGVKNLDFSLFKNNRFNDGKWNAQIRIEAFNVLNRTQFNAPNTQVGTAAFGTISGAGGARQVQIGLKMMFVGGRALRAGRGSPRAAAATRRRWAAGGRSA